MAVRMTAASINPSDLVTIAGAYPSRTPLPLVPGFEGVGRVIETGPGVDIVSIGDRVVPIGSSGAWQQVKTTAARWCFRVLPELTDEQAALSYINPLTAFRMVEDFVNPRGVPTVAVNAAGSAIAGMVARLLHQRGVPPVALVRGAVDRESTSGPEWAAVLDTRKPDWEQELVHVTDGGPEVAFDAIGGEDGTRLVSTLRHGGSLVHYGLLSGRPLPATLRQQRPDVQIHFYRLRDWVHSAGYVDLQDGLDTAGRLVLDGTAVSRLRQTFPLEEVHAALCAAQERGGQGKVLLLP
ncbi:zinc-dependent alcohol dehydrogenase family protein [Nocardia coubleae]|uniref:zinc-dependent alcohol dehydrogenase family protein n=1 Tax=Nocardia coubleae TaxID=356147 RepID=UPI001B345EEE|nr:zinc-dependent alcohol dehydrogenase family protein [Nocardia coubleae]